MKKEVSKENSKKEKIVMRHITMITCPNCKERVIAWDNRCPRCGCERRCQFLVLLSSSIDQFQIVEVTNTKF